MINDKFGIIKSGNIDTNNLNRSISEYDREVGEIVSYLGLPTNNIVQNVNERGRIFRNLRDVISEITKSKDSMYYLSKFIYAAADGLFDAALNYLWDATISELRERIANFDVEYFYDTLIVDPKRRSKLHGVKDLPQIQDADLLRGAKEIELISEVDYDELLPISKMRNSSSTAHPAEKQVTGFQLIAWLETCIKDVFNLPDSLLNIRIKKLLKAVRTEELPDDMILTFQKTFNNLTDLQINALINGFFGIYISDSSTNIARSNINKLLPKLWVISSDDERSKIGMKYGSIRINGEKEKGKFAFDFIEIVNGQKYIPSDLKASEIQNILSQLRSANDGINNFYIEPALAEQLSTFIDENSSVPTSVEDSYIKVLIYCYVTNGNGIAWEANDIYENLIKQFSSSQSLKALLSFTDNEINGKFTNKLCTTQFKKMLGLIQPNVVQNKFNDLLEFILQFNGPLNKIQNDARYKKEFSNFVNTNDLRIK